MRDGLWSGAAATREVQAQGQGPAAGLSRRVYRGEEVGGSSKVSSKE